MTPLADDVKGVQTDHLMEFVPHETACDLLQEEVLEEDDE